MIDDPALLPHAIEELLRYESPVPAVARFAIDDFEIGGEQIHAGDSLHCCSVSPTSIPAAIPEP